MKKLITTFIFCGFLAAVFGQNITASHDTLHLVMPLDSFDKQAHNIITNPSATPKTIKWTREIIEIAPHCQSYICDPNACYLPTASSKQYTLQGNSTGTLDLHLKNLDTTKLCCATIKIKLEVVGSPANKLDLLYFFNDCAVILDENEAFALEAKVYPNPVSDFFFLENADEVATLKVLSRDGREVKNFKATPDQKYNIADLPAGQYFVILAGEKGNGIRAVEIVKN